MTFLLLFTSLVTPYRIAYYDVDEPLWIGIDSFVDMSFAVDIVLNFFMGFYDAGDDIVDRRSLIAINYIKTWFLIDIVSILPISQFMNTKNYSSLARIARLPKLYRLIKIFR